MSDANIIEINGAEVNLEDAKAREDIETINTQLGDIANNFTTQQINNNFIIKYKNDIIATIPIGGGTVTTTFTIEKNLFNCTINNNDDTIEQGCDYSGKLTPNDGYNLSNIKIYVSNIDITDTAYDVDTGQIFIGVVDGNIIINARAVKQGETDTDDTPIVGSIDSSNVIMLNNLIAGNYTLKYEDDAGVLANYDSITIMEVK